MRRNITKKDIKRYTCGDCHLLAREIERISGWPMYSFVKYGETAIHCFNKMPDGRYVDIEGPKTPREFREVWTDYWGGPGIARRVDWDRLVSDGWIESPTFGRYSEQRLVEIAPEVVRRAGA